MNERRDGSAAAGPTQEPVGADPTPLTGSRRPRVDVLLGLLPFLRPHAPRALLALTLLLAASAALLAVPWAFRDVVDAGFTRAGATRGEVDRHFLVLLGIAAFWAAAVAARYYLVTWLGERVTADLRNAVYARVLGQSAEFHETLQSGEVLSRLTGDATLVQTLVGSSLSMGLRSVVQFAGSMVMLAVTSFLLFAINVAVLVLVVLPIIVASRRLRRLSRDSQDRIADASALAGEVLPAVATVQAFGREAGEVARFAERVEQSFRVAMGRTRMRAALTAVTIVAVFAAFLFVLWLGARAVIAGDLTPGTLVSFVLYAVLAAGSVGVLAEVWGDVQRAAGAMERLLELLAAEPAVRSPATPRRRRPPPRGAALDFDEVVFSYPSRPGVRAIDGLCLHVAAGETLAVVGRTGAGKSTLFQLALRFHDVQTGSVRLDGVDVRELDLGELRAAIALVPQDPVIFSGDVATNIRYGRPGASDAEVHAAARAAFALEFIERLPEGFATRLGERGVRLSGGQRQRIAIARAMLCDAPLLLLDEATSALDAESERWVQQGLAEAMRGRTTLVIAHRLATVRNADRVVVMEEGRIIEAGTPDALLGQSGRFSALARLQWLDAGRSPAPGTPVVADPA